MAHLSIVVTFEFWVDFISNFFGNFISELMLRGGLLGVLFQNVVSHSLGVARAFADKALWERPSHSKIAQLDLTRLIYENILRFDITVNYIR